MIKKIFILLLLLAAFAVPSWAQFDFGAMGAANNKVKVTFGPVVVPTGFTPSNATASDTAAGGTVITLLTVTMSDRSNFNGTCGYGVPISNTDPLGLTTISSASGGCTLSVISGGYTPANDGIYQYSINVCKTGQCLNPSTVNFTLTIKNNSIGGLVPLLSLTNGPPNLSQGLMPAGVGSGTPVSDVYADNTNESPFSGTFSITSGPFSVTTATNCGSAGNITCGHITTNTAGLSGVQSGTVTANGATLSFSINFVSGTTAACSSTGIQTAINAAGANGTVLLPACSYSGSNAISASLVPDSGTRFVGIPGQTILDQGGNSPGNAGVGDCVGNFFCSNVATTANVTIANVTMQNIGTNSPNTAGCTTSSGPSQCANQDEFIGTGPGWTVQNTIMQNGVFVGIGLHGDLHGATSTLNIINNTIAHVEGYGSIGSTMAGSTYNWIGNEIYDINNASGGYVDCGDGCGQKFLDNNFTFNFKYNYLHDQTNAVCWWEDSGSSDTMLIQGNTFINCGTGPTFEAQNATSTIVDKNVFTDTVTVGGPSSLSYGPVIFIHGSPGTVVTNNNISVIQTDIAIGAKDDDCRGSGLSDDNTIIGGSGNGNTITFVGGPAPGPSSDNGGATHTTSACSAAYGFTGSSADYNAYHMPGGTTSDAHFTWFNATSWSSPILSFASMQSTYGQETHSSVDTVDGTAPGCLHAACSFSPVGSGGVNSTAPAPALAGCSTINGGGPNDGSCFNTEVANFDFTGATASFSGSMTPITITPSNISSWLACDGAATPLLYIASATGGTGPCSAFLMANDGGIQVIDGQWLPSYGFNNIALSTAAFRGAGINLPNEYYVEFVWRSTATAETVCDAPSSGRPSDCPVDIWSYGNTNNGLVMEWDFQEMFSPNSADDAAGSNAGAGPCPDGTSCQFLDQHNWSLISGFDHTVYHTYGERVTQDGNGKIMYCWYLDGIQYNIENGDGGTTPPGSNCREIDAVAAYGTQILPNLNTPIAMFPLNPGWSIASPLPTGNIDAYEKYFRIYSCANWNAANTAQNGFACAGHLISSNP